MFNIESFRGRIAVPFILEDFEITYDGELFYNNQPSSLKQFNDVTKLTVESTEVLQCVTFHKFNWPPKYWKHLTALKCIDGINTPENMVLGLHGPVESYEFSGFYMIPYFSNYVISKDGRLIKRSDGIEIKASKANTGYYTYRMRDDSGATANELRHRIKSITFLKYEADVESLDVNHKDGVPGNDDVVNLEWVTRSENNIHAVNIGLKRDNIEVQVYDSVSQETLIFASYSQAGRFLGVTETTISNRVKSNGYKAYDGFQFRKHPCNDAWPVITEEDGGYIVTFPNGKERICTAIEAARHLGVTRTSLLRLIREGRSQGSNENTVRRNKSGRSESCVPLSL